MFDIQASFHHPSSLWWTPQTLLITACWFLPLNTLYVSVWYIVWICILSFTFVYSVPRVFMSKKSGCPCLCHACTGILMKRLKLSSNFSSSAGTCVCNLVRVHIRWRPNKHSFKRPHISTLFIKTVVECNDGWCTHNSVRKIVPDIVLSVGPVRPSVRPSYKKLEIRADPKLYFLSLSVRCYVTADCRRSRTSSWTHIIFLSHARCSFISYISYCICLSVCVANKLHHKMRNAIA